MHIYVHEIVYTKEEYHELSAICNDYHIFIVFVLPYLSVFYNIVCKTEKKLLYVIIYMPKRYHSV